MRDKIIQLKWLGLLIAIIWAVEIANILSFYSLNKWFGLLPRSAWGLIGLPLMPVLHTSISHAAANTIPLLILGFLMQVSAPRKIIIISAFIIFCSGLAIWLFGRSTIHVGASGLIFGWLGFLLARGYVERTFGAIAMALAVGLVYGAILWGVLPMKAGLSWESYLFGALAGVAAAFIVRREREPAESQMH